MKRVLFFAATAIYSFGFFYCLPIFLTIAFNFGKGIQANEDGIFLIPFALIILFATTLIEVLLVRKSFKLNGFGNLGKTVIILSICLIFVVTVLVVFPLWKSFFEVLAFYKGPNLSLQYQR